MTDTTTSVEVLLQHVIAKITPTQPSVEHLASMMAAAGIYAQFVAAFATIPGDPECAANARDALGDAFLWTLRSIVDPQRSEREASQEKEEDKRNLVTEYLRLRQYFDMQLPYNQEKHLAIAAVKYAYQLALDSLMAQEQEARLRRIPKEMLATTEEAL